MKTLLTTIIAIFALSFTSSAQWTTSGTNIYNSNTGNVGIGTTAPVYQLHLVHTSTTNDVTSARQFAIGVDGSTSYNFSMGYYANTTTGLWTGVIQTRDAGTGSPLVLNPLGGAVGIGTPSPRFPLEVDAPSVANGSSNAIFLLNPSNTAGAGASITFGGPSNIYTSGSIRGYLVNASSGGTGKLILGSRTSGTSNEELALYNGNVGIGTFNPDQKLTVAGQVHSTSVVVTSSVPADYVFNNNYYLRPLADVKTFVDINHHLPEVPSAADFKKDGQNLGEMNMTLLKKVEELTLYMIEKDKQLKQQQEINEAINRRLDDLTSQLKALKQ